VLNWFCSPFPSGSRGVQKEQICWGEGKLAREKGANRREGSEWHSWVGFSLGSLDLFSRLRVETASKDGLEVLQ